MRLFLAAAALVCALTPAALAAAALRPMPTPRHSLGAVVVDGQLYAVGGMTAGAPTAAVERYDPRTNRWQALAPLATARYCFAIAAAGHEIFVLGGESGHGRLASMEIFDTRTGAWSEGPPLPEPRALLSAAVVDGVLYAAGGSPTVSRSLSRVDAFDTRTRAWSTAPEMTVARSGAGVAAAGGRLWLLGGSDDGARRHLSSMESFDPARNSWSSQPGLPRDGIGAAAEALGKVFALGGASAERPDHDSMYSFDGRGWSNELPMPTGRSAFAAASADGRLFAVGGSPGRNQVLDTLEIYDAASKTWRTSAPRAGPSQPAPQTADEPAPAPMPTGRFGLAAAAVGGKIYALGGMVGSEPLDAVEAYDPAANSWRKLPPMPTPRALFGAAVVGKKIYAIGGDTGQARLASVEVFDTETESWSRGPALPRPLSNAGITVLGETIYAAGGSWGMEAGMRHVAETLALDTRSGQWRSLASISSPRSHAELAALAGRLYIAGGSADEVGPHAKPAQWFDIVESYDPRSDSWRAEKALPAAHSGALVATGGRLYSIGGGSSGVADWATVYSFSPGRGWSEEPSMPTGRSTLAAAALGHLIFALGGSPGRNIALNTLEIYDTRLKTWRTSQGAGASLQQPVTREIPAPRPQGRPSFYDDVESPASPATRQRPADFALAIGLDDYRSVAASEFGQRDAEAFARYATAKLGVPEENVITLSGQRATKTDIVKYVEEWLPRNVDENSRVFVYFSGHGAPDPENGSSYLLPWDGDPMFLQSTAYPVRQLYDKLAGLKARKVVVFLDACFSGAGGRSVIAKNLRPLVHVIDAAVPKTGKLTVLTASGASQVAGGFESKRHGLFTYYLLKGLGGEAAGKDGALEMSGLYEFVKAGVRKQAHRENREQDPQLHTSEPRLRLY